MILINVFFCILHSFLNTVKWGSKWCLFARAPLVEHRKATPSDDQGTSINNMHTPLAKFQLYKYRDKYL